MLIPLALLPVLAVTVTDVTTRVHDDGLTVDVVTSEPIAASQVRPMAGPRVVYLYVDGSKPEQTSFRSNGRTVIARERARYTKLEIPLAAGQRCAEPAQIMAAPSGISVEFSCSKPAASVGEAASLDHPDPATKPQPSKSTRSEELLNAALALPAELPFDKLEDESEAAKPEAAEPKAMVRDKAPAPKSKGRPEALPVAAPVADTPAPGLTAQAPSAPGLPAQGPMLAGVTGGGSWFVLGILLLVGAVGGMLALSRRRTRREGLIRILETAAIGPKRSLLVARVNGRTMVLGASEAGIALLETIEGQVEAPVARVMGEPPPVRERSEAAAPARELPPEQENEGGVLRRLFRRRPKLVSVDDESSFRDLLAESYEDQELRERLSQGLVAKVS